ncbi:MAG: imidazolonepropionase [Nitrososphaerales archaeon]
MAKSRIKADLVIRNIGQLLSLRGHSRLPVVRPNSRTIGLIDKPQGSSIASCSGKICFVGSNSHVSAEVETTSAVEIDAKNNLVLPGFVDSHTHAIFAGSREEEIQYKISGLSYLQILKRGGGILKTVAQTRAATNEDLISETRQRLDNMVSSGTTTFEVKTGYGLSVKEEIRLLELIRELKQEFGYDIESTLLSAHALPAEYRKSREFVEEVVLPTIDIAAQSRLAKFCDVFMEKGVFDGKETEQILTYSQAKGLEAKIHADEFSDLGGAALASRLKVRSADHLLRTSKQGMASLGKTKTVCVLLPGTSLASFAPAYANARGLMEAGAPVALASDLSPNSWIESMQFVASLACYGMKMTPEEALVGATINGAHAIGRGKDVGSIEEGKSCDVLITEVKKYQEIPYRIASNCVTHVIKKGALIREN